MLHDDRHRGISRKPRLFQPVPLQVKTGAAAVAGGSASALDRVQGLENGYWISVKNGQPINPATGGTGTRGDTHIPLPSDTMPPKR